MASDLKVLYGAHDDTTLSLALMEWQLGQAHRMATDPRDLIYCLFGMAKAILPEAEIPLVPAYNMAVEDVFTGFTAILLDWLPYRTVLSLVADKPHHDSYVQRLPSWVPDFSTVSEVSTTIQRTLMKNTQDLPDLLPGYDEPESSWLSINRGKLMLLARPVGDLDHMFQLGWYNSAGPRSTSSRYLQDIAGMTAVLQGCQGLIAQRKWECLVPFLRILCFNVPTIVSDPVFITLWRKLLSIVRLEPRRMSTKWSLPREVTDAADDLAGMFEELKGVSFVPTPTQVEAEEKTLDILISMVDVVDTEVALQCQKQLKALWPEHFTTEDIIAHSSEDAGEHEETRYVEELFEREFEAFRALYTQGVDPRDRANDTFFTTARGIVGRAIGRLLPGDQLWLIFRAKVPYVLRPTSDGQYILVGEALVHDTRNGGPL
ncbi:hypothetical protein LTR78_005841 [Recurvomyces mirabilis]|uniref:Uncharacterized protein n=1 Tax=Recurvomyces mirabilis TaxID=574656 RepID=A0AAE0WMD5_9PEZI|nr:hypothetical protein LTR78_005841 [Recurvomyces mirabilis]KAK5154221.1 hypothetical protein LTS14_006906 [Recurvomyces mirabilis]